MNIFPLQGENPDTWGQDLRNFFADTYDLSSGRILGQIYSTIPYGNLAATIAAIGSTPATLIINRNEIVSTALVIPSTLHIQVVGIGGFTKSGTGTLTINGPFETQLRQVFSGFSAGDILFGVAAIAKVYPQWWGAIPDGIVDNTSAIQEALDSVQPSGGTVFFPAGTYITISPLTTYSNVYMQGSGRITTSIKTITDNFPGFMIRGVDVNNVRFLDFSLQGPGQSASQGSGISLTRINNNATDNVIAQNLFMHDFAGDGFFVSAPILTSLRNVRIQTCAGAGFSMIGGTSTNFYECYSLTNSQTGFRMDTMTYCSFNGCAVEGNGIGYELLTSRNIAFLACGSEQAQYRSAAYPGRAYSLIGGKDNTLISCYSSEFAVATGTEKTHIYVSGEINDTVIGFRGNATTIAPDNTYKFVGGAKVAMLNSEFTGLIGAGAVGSSLLLLDGALGVGNSVANVNIPIGATSKAVEIFDAAGVSLGFIPIYASQW